MVRPVRHFLPKISSPILAIAFFFVLPPAWAGMKLPEATPGMSAAQIDTLRYPSSAWLPAYLDELQHPPALLLPSDFDTKILPPPANSSAETRADLDAMLKMQAQERTPDQVKRIHAENNVATPVDLFISGGLFDPAVHPKTVDVLKTANDNVTYFILREKLKYERPRPTQLDLQLTTVISVPPHASYPSGHAGQSFMAALVLGTIDPPHKDGYEKMAIAIAHRREIAGVHYPSDSEAGRGLARVVFAALAAQPQFAAHMTQARQEFAVQAQRPGNSLTYTKDRAPE